MAAVAAAPSVVSTPMAPTSADERDRMYAVVGIWTMDEARRGDQLAILTERIVPGVKASPGFVAGYWMADPASGKSHSTVVFVNEECARAFKATVEQGAQDAARSGVTNDTLIVASVAASA